MRKEEQMGKETEVFGTEEALARISMELLSPSDKKLLTVSDVTPDEIFGLSLLRRFAEILGSDIIYDWVRDFLLLRISRFRGGRGEFVIINTGLKDIGDLKKKGDIKSAFAGLR